MFPRDRGGTLIIPASANPTGHRSCRQAATVIVAAHERARRAAVALSREGADTDATQASGIMLLADLRELFAAERREVLFTTEILQALCDREDRPYSEHQRGRQITASQLASLLRPFGIPTNQTVRRSTATAKGYKAKDCKDAWARYLPAFDGHTVTRSHMADSLASGGSGSVTSEET